MKVTFTIDMPQKDFELLCKKINHKKPHKIPNLLKGRKGMISAFTYFHSGLNQYDRPSGEMSLYVLDPLEDLITTINNPNILKL